MPSKEEYFNPDSPAQSNKHWIPWIQRQLILHGILAQALELPEPYEPNYEKYCKVFEQMKISKDTMLIGHSLGAGFLVRWLSENKTETGRVALVAPFLDPDHDEVRKDFFTFEIDSEISKRAEEVLVIYSSNDEPEILTSVDQIKKTIQNVEEIVLSKMGHLTFRGMKTEKFPELAEWLLK